jgi:HlyD family secretion protein
LARRIHLRKYWGPIAAVGTALLVGAVSWSMVRSTPVKYVTAPVTSGSITRVATATGTVNPVLTIIIGTYVSGVIQNLFCDYNTQVRAGQVCAKIDPRPYQATFDQYNAQLLRDKAALEKDRADLVRYQSLAATNAIARQQAEDQVYVVNQDEATVRLDEALVDGAKLNLAYTDIISPVDGTVVSRSVTGGQTVAASFQTPTLFLIATDLKQMEVDTNSSEGDMGGIKEGEEATFTVDAFPQRVFYGRVTQIRQSPQTVQNVVTYDVVIGVDNSDLALMPGMTASTQIIVDRRNDVLRIPNQSLRYLPGGPLAVQGPGNGMSSSRQSQVWILRDAQPVAVTITPGLNDENFTEVVKGDLRPGDQVIISEINDQASGQSGLPPPRL